MEKEADEVGDHGVLDHQPLHPNVSMRDAWLAAELGTAVDDGGEVKSLIAPSIL